MDYLILPRCRVDPQEIADWIGKSSFTSWEAVFIAGEDIVIGDIIYLCPDGKLRKSADGFSPSCCAHKSVKAGDELSFYFNGDL